MQARLALNFPEAAKALGISRSTLEKLVRSGDLHAFIVSGGKRSRRISIRALEEFMEKRTYNDIKLPEPKQ